MKSILEPSLNENIECDILIVGGGMAGMNVAYNLKDEDLNIVLIDKGKIGYGVTSKTTGKITFLQGDIYNKIEKIYDFDMAKRYFESQVEAINIISNIIKENNIKCDFEMVDSYIFSKNDLSCERAFLNKLNLYYRDNKLNIDLKYKDSLSVSNTAVFNPLKYLEGLKKIVLDNIKIYENTKAISLDIENNRYTIKTDGGTIKTKKLIVCSHYPFFIIPGLIPFKIHQERSYVLVTKSENMGFSAINMEKPIKSIRYHKNYMLFSGYSHHLSDKLDYKKEENKLLDFYKKNFNNKILYSWQAHDNMTNDYIPMIGRLNKNHPNLFIATGFNKWGMTNGVLAGKILSDIVLNRYNKYESLFDPSRSFNLNKFLNMLGNNYKIGKTYISLKLKKPQLKNAFVTKIDGVLCGVYISKSGKKHIVRNICPHLKCNLVFNSSDKTWDCPCHGSRFDIDGNLLEGPSVFSIEKD